MPRTPNSVKLMLGIPNVFSCEGIWTFPEAGVSPEQAHFSTTGFLLVNKQYGECLDVAWDRQTRTLYRWVPHKSLNQQWYFHLRDDGNLAIVSRLTGMAMEVADGRHDQGSRIIQDRYHGNPSQLWRAEELEDGTHRIISVHSGLYLNMLAEGLPDGGVVVQEEWHGGDNQRWRILPAI